MFFNFDLWYIVHLTVENNIMNYVIALRNLITGAVLDVQ